MSIVDFLQANGCSLAFQRTSDLALSRYWEVLSPREREEYFCFKVEKRKREWFAGRVAVKKAVHRLTKSALSQIEVSPSQGYPPQIVCLPDVRLSLSHSGEWACGLATLAQNQNAVGVDLQKIEDRLDDVAFISFTPQELLWIQEDVFRYWQFWSAKEAVLKQLGLGLTVDLREVSVQLILNKNQVCIYFQGKCYFVSSFKLGNYFLSICLDKLK